MCVCGSPNGYKCPLSDLWTIVPTPLHLKYLNGYSVLTIYLKISIKPQSDRSVVIYITAIREKSAVIIRNRFIALHVTIFDSKAGVLVQGLLGTFPSALPPYSITVHPNCHWREVVCVLQSTAKDQTFGYEQLANTMYSTAIHVTERLYSPIPFICFVYCRSLILYHKVALN